ncbi:MAG TPA: hypothetical protein DD640_02060 [Clostridiales bacterium]|nr:hypothetical protein [Clostridiales bacterium]
MTVTLCETQLYEPVRQYWAAAGYEVRGEVSGCDVIACGGDDWIAIELKTSLNLEVILQAVQRQKMVSQAWIAIPRPGGRAMHSQRWRRLMHLLRRLELGLLLVDFNRQPAGVEAALLAIPFDRAQSQSKNKGKARRLRQEFERRHGDRNPGGIHRTALMTAYREQALLTAALLERGGSASAAQLRRQGGPANTYRILYKNHYGWFISSGSGQYDLTAEGRAALAAQTELADLLLAEVKSGV